MTDINQINFLSPTGFRLEIEKIPFTTFFAQKCDIPVVDMHLAEIHTPMLDYNLPGNKLKFGNFTMSVIVDENMENYNEIIKWLYGINNPESLDNNREYSFLEQYRLMYSGKSLYKTLFSDGILHILTNNNNENISIQFYDMFPMSVSKITMQSTVDEVRYVTFDVKFNYSHFKRIT